MRKNVNDTHTNRNTEVVCCTFLIYFVDILCGLNMRMGLKIRFRSNYEI